jgi:hypothetical protein
MRRDYEDCINDEFWKIPNSISRKCILDAKARDLSQPQLKI